MSSRVKRMGLPRQYRKILQTPPAERKRMRAQYEEFMRTTVEDFPKFVRRSVVSDPNRMLPRELLEAFNAKLLPIYFFWRIAGIALFIAGPVMLIAGIQQAIEDQALLALEGPLLIALGLSALCVAFPVSKRGLERYNAEMNLFRPHRDRLITAWDSFHKDPR